MKTKKRMRKFVWALQKAGEKFRLHDGEVVEALILIYGSLSRMHGVSKETALDSVDAMLDFIYDDNSEILEDGMSQPKEIH